MNEAIPYLAAFGAGLALGTAFFGGLWWVVRRLARGDGSPWLYPLSALLRIALLLGGFWWVAAGDLLRLAACLAGWLLARQLVISLTGKGGAACT